MSFNPSLKEITDSELMHLYKEDGDQYLMGELFKRYLTLVYGVCLKYLKDRETAKDAAMDIFEKLPLKISETEIINFKAWLYTVSRNHCLMILRSRKGENTEEISPFLMESNTEMHLESEQELEGNLGKLENCIEKLNAEQKHCVRLFFLEQRCYQEVSETTCYELNKVKSYIQNGKRNLKMCMERND